MALVEGPHRFTAFQSLSGVPLGIFRAFLKFANQLVILAFSVGEVVVGQLSVLLFELTFHLIPGTLHLKFVHTLIVRFRVNLRPVP